ERHEGIKARRHEGQKQEGQKHNRILLLRASVPSCLFAFPYLLFFLFRSFFSMNPDFLVRIDGPPGIPRPASFPPARPRISFNLPSMFMPPTARIMSRVCSNCF